MKKSKLMRLISGIMLVVAVIFVFCALSNPALGSTIYIPKEYGMFVARNS